MEPKNDQVEDRTREPSEDKTSNEEVATSETKPLFKLKKADQVVPRSLVVEQNCIR